MGTPSITGTFTGTGRIQIRASSPPNLYGHTLAATECDVEWVWDFDNHLVTVNGASSPAGSGTLYPSAAAPAGITTCVEYRVRQIGTPASSTVPFIDNGDGTYTVLYDWFVNVAGGRNAATNIRLEITTLRDCQTPGQFTKLSISTWPQGYSAIPGTPLVSSGTSFPPPAGEFFNHATPDWNGCASAS